ncbi:MAG: DNA-binding protein [Rhodoglobus sp.]|nr:DNA-binding protein [Rhodoglobus sp.]
MSLEDINTLEQTAEYLKITPTVLIGLARAGKIGALKQGRVWTFPRTAIAEYIEANTTPMRPANPFGLTDRSWQRLQRERRAAVPTDLPTIE